MWQLFGKIGLENQKIIALEKRLNEIKYDKKRMQTYKLQNKTYSETEQVKQNIQ